MGDIAVSYYPSPYYDPKDWHKWAALFLVAAIVVLTAGCTPLTPAQREIRNRERFRDTVEYCEVRGPTKDCYRIPRERLDPILRGTL